jgi:3-oxoadipate enol-lactonase
MHRVTHHDRRTAYRVTDRGGDGPPLLLVHGSGATGAVWTGQAPLATDRPIVAIDLSGHGESDDVAATPGYETLAVYADDAAAVARETGARTVVGHSLGGAVALWLALERGVALDGLVLAGTGARLAVLDDLLAWLDDDFDRALEFLHAPDRLFHDPDADPTDVSRTAMRETGPRVTARDFRTAHAFDVRDRLGAVTVPALAVVGVHDRLTPPWYHEALAEGLSDCGLATLPDAAHLAMLETPAAFNDAVTGFVDRRSSAPTGTD